MPKENLSRHSVQNLGAWRCQRPEASSPFFRGDVSVALASVVNVDIEVGQPGHKEGGMHEAEQLSKDQAITNNSQDANNIIFCHELLNKLW